MTKTEREKLKARLLAETRARHEAIESAPGFAEQHAEWRKTYEAETAMYAARQRANITQAELARRMNIPRSNVSRIEHGQNITLATLTRYLRACGFDFRFSIFPLGSTPKDQLALA